MAIKINNIDELKSEINRLSLLKTEQETYLGNQYTLLKNKVSAPIRIVNSIFSSVPGVGLVKGLFNSGGKSKSKSDWLTRSLQLGLPLVLNNTFLKKAGWLKKSLVLIASETAAGQVTKDKVNSLIGRLSNFIRPKKKKNKDSKIVKEDSNTTDFRKNYDKINDFDDTSTES